MEEMINNLGKVFKDLMEQANKVNKMPYEEKKKNMQYMHEIEGMRKAIEAMGMSYKFDLDMRENFKAIEIMGRRFEVR